MATGSLAGQSVDAFLKAITNVAPEKVLCRFLDYPPSRGTLGFPRCLFENPFPLNPDFYLKGIDFSCVSPWNDSYGVERAGTAISKRHIVFAKHFPIAKGTRMAFVGQNGEVSHYTVKDTRELKSCDIAIGLLDYELTPDIRPACILPENYTNAIPIGLRLPLVTFNKREQATLGEIEIILTSDKTRTRLKTRRLAREELKPYETNAVRGDSGSPAFMIYNGHPILVYCLLTGGAGRGPSLHNHRLEIQQMMDELCPGYRLAEFDFSKVGR